MRLGARVRDERRGQVTELDLPTSCAPNAPPSPPRLSQYMGQKYTRVEEIRNGDDVVAHVIEFRRIEQRDQALFLSAITDCGGSLVRRVAK